GAAALTTRAWTRTLPGSITLAALTTGAFALLVGSALASTGLRATPALAASATLACALTALVAGWVSLTGRALVTCLALSVTASALTLVSGGRLLAAVEMPAGAAATLIGGAAAVAFAGLRRLPGASRPFLEVILAVVGLGTVSSALPSSLGPLDPLLAAACACGAAAVGLLAPRPRPLPAARPAAAGGPPPHPAFSTAIPGIALILTLVAAVELWQALANPAPLLVGLLLATAALLAAGLWRATGPDQLLFAAVVAPAGWVGLAVLPVGGRNLWWPLGLAGGLALLLGALAVRFRAARPPLLTIAAATTACLPALTLTLGQVQTDHLGTALLLVGIGGNQVLFALPRAADQWVRGVRLTLVLLGLGGALLLAWQLPAGAFPLLGVAAAGLLVALTLGLLADRTAPAFVLNDAPRYAAAAPLSCLALLAPVGRPVPSGWLLGIVVAGTLTVLAGHWRLGRGGSAAQRSLNAGIAGTAVLTTLSGCGLLSVHHGADWGRSIDLLELLLFPITPQVAGGQTLPWAALAVTIPLALLFLLLAWQPWPGARPHATLPHRVLFSCCVVLLATASAAHALGAVQTFGLRAAQLLIGLTLSSLPALALADSHWARLPRPGSPLPPPVHPATTQAGNGTLAGPAPASARDWAYPNGASTVAGLPAPVAAAPPPTAARSGMLRLWQQRQVSLLLVALAAVAHLLVYVRLETLSLTAPPE
ncbi:MAG: hypothetical protein Q4B08_15395, partial [Propionibacteriaceae bacterium]|nr:hypothetical protein [Propionibacteriaceae bacterium]